MMLLRIRKSIEQFFRYIHYNIKEYLSKPKKTL